MSAPGRIMALDLGEQRIGIALSDPLRIVATPHSVWLRDSRAKDFAHYAALITANAVTLVVVGLPRGLAGQETPFSAWVRDYAGDLAGRLGVAVQLHDEALTTELARERMVALGYNRRKRAAQRDAVAAAFILQDYLDRLGRSIDPDGGV